MKTIFNPSPEPWALPSITMTLKTSPQRNQMSMKGCERKPFGRQVMLTISIDAWYDDTLKEQNICNCRAPLFSWEESLSTCSSRPSTTSPPQAGTMLMCECSELVSGKSYILEIIVWAGIHVLCEDNLNLRLYYEFVNYSTIGFGDLIPSDEATVGGRWHIQ